MALSRRSFIKVAGAAAGAILVSFGLQNATVDVIKAKYVPGAGHPETETEFEVDKVYNERIDKIDTQAFLAACSRCGVCIQKCPFNAIKSKSLAVPQLNDVTIRKCPGYENCGICATVCPTDCLHEAFSDYDKKPDIDKPDWWEGPYEKAERQPGI